jgi:hypothetical protein
VCWTLLIATRNMLCDVINHENLCIGHRNQLARRDFFCTPQIPFDEPSRPGMIMRPTRSQSWQQSQSDRKLIQIMQVMKCPLIKMDRKCSRRANKPNPSDGPELVHQSSRVRHTEPSSARKMLKRSANRYAPKLSDIIAKRVAYAIAH